MKLALTTAASCAAFALVASGMAYAQQQQPNTEGGVTSGPATNSPTTLGSGGNVPASPHQLQGTQKSGGQAINGEEKGQQGGSGTSMPSKQGTEAGSAPSDTSGGSNK